MNTVRIALAAVLLMPAVSGAQTVPQRLTLAEALALARTHNPEHRKALNDEDVASAQVRQSYGAFLPTVGASLGFSGTSARTSTGEDDFGGVVGGETRTIESSSGRQSVSASMTLFDGGAMFREIGAARAEERLAHATVRAAANVLTADVQRSYYQAQRAVRTVELEERLLASARERLERSEQLFRIAAASQVDVLGARVDVASQEQALATARDNARKLRLALLQTMGVPPRDADDLELVEPDPAPFDPATLDVAALVSLALSSSPQVLQREAAAAAAARRAGVARAARWPSLTASVGYNRSLREPGMFDAFGQFGAQDRGVTFGLSAELPVFSNFRTGASVTRAEAGAEDAREDVRATRLQTEREVRAAVIDLQNAYGQLALAQRKAELSAQRLELATEQYRLGALTFLNLQRVIEETSAAERQALDAQFGFVNARVALEEKLGAPLPQP